jgi:hypothetical protein
MFPFRLVAAGLAAGLLLAACGDDDTAEDAADDTTETTAAAEEETTTSTTAGGEQTEGDDSELCALANEMFQQDEFPSADQLRRYQELAPEEIQDAVAIAAPAVIENEGDFVATFAAFAEDDVEAALAEINAFENENCNTGHDESETVPPVSDPEEGAQVVEVTAVEFAFDIPAVTAGRTSFVLTNGGEQAHHMIVVRVLEGTLEEALAFEGDPVEAGLVEDVGSSGNAAPGGEDTEVVTGDIEPGDYGMLCFLPDVDGTPHAFKGMAVPFTVS